MAAVIPEAAESVTEGTAAVRGASTAGRARAGAGRHRGAPSRSESAARDQVAGQARERGKRTASRIGRARVPGDRNYQTVILAEFLVAVLVLGLAPVAKGGTDTAKAKGSASPYDTNSMKQLLMVGLIYFILALLSSGRNTGRIAAWFGGLVLVGIGVQQTVNGGFAAVLHMFGFNVGGGLGNYPGSGLLPSLNINVGQFSPGALAAGVQQSGTQVVPVPDATGNFPVINPSTTQSGGLLPTLTQGPPPGVAAPDNATVSTVSPPPGGSGVITT